MRRQRQETPEERKRAETDRANSGTNGLSEPRGKLPGSEGQEGPHDRDRICDPYHVNGAVRSTDVRVRITAILGASWPRHCSTRRLWSIWRPVGPFKSNSALYFALVIRDLEDL